MILQDILNVLSGPQGWSMIIGCILVLLLALVYCRIGKLATTTKRDFSELRDAMEILGARLDVAQQVAGMQSPPVPEEEVPGAEDMVPEPPVLATDTMLAEASVTAEEGAGLMESEVETVPQPQEAVDADLADAADIGAEPDSDIFDFSAPEPVGDEGEGIGLDIPSETLGGPDEVVDDTQAASDDASFGFDVQVSSDAEQVEDDSFSMAEEESRFAEESQEEWETSEDSGDFRFGGDDLAMEPVADAVGFEEETTEPGMDEHDEAEPPAAGLETAPVADTFQFGSSDSDEKAEEPLSKDAEDQAFATTAMGDQSLESFAPDAADASEAAAMPQPEVIEESSATVQMPSVGPFEASAEVPPEPVEAPANQPSPTPSIPSLEPLPGNPDKPNVGVARCRECGRKIAYPKRLSGKRMRCPACQSAALLP